MKIIRDFNSIYCTFRFPVRQSGHTNGHRYNREREGDTIPESSSGLVEGRKRFAVGRCMSHSVLAFFQLATPTIAPRRTSRRHRRDLFVRDEKAMRVSRPEAFPVRASGVNENIAFLKFSDVQASRCISALRGLLNSVHDRTNRSAKFQKYVQLEKKLGTLTLAAFG